MIMSPRQTRSGTEKPRTENRQQENAQRRTEAETELAKG